MREGGLMRALLLAALVAGCPKNQVEAGPGPVPTATAKAGSKPVERGAPLDFALEPLDRDYESQPESTALRGKRAIVLVVATYDVGSLLALRTLAPMLNELPKDAACLQVAMQPSTDRVLISAFMDAEKTPCRRAIGDPKGGRLGDLAKIKIFPTVLVLRADGTLVGGHAGKFEAADVKALLDAAK
jgi:hypothetical protein